MAYMFFPILLNGLYNIFYEKGKNSYLLTIGAVGILLSHNISSLLAIAVCGIYVICHLKTLFGKQCRTQIWKNLIINAIFIILLVSFFYLPFIEHITSTEYVATQEGTMSTKDSVSSHALYIYQLIFGKYQRGFSSALSEGIDKDMNFSLGLPILVPLVFTPFVINKLGKRKKLYIITLIIGIVSALMSTTLFPWSKMPNIMLMIQFPWRMLLISTILLSIIAGINISKCFENFTLQTVIIMTLVIVMYSVQYISNVATFKTEYDESYLEKVTQIDGIGVNVLHSDYLPVKAKREYIVERTEGVIVLSGKAVIQDEEKQKNNMTFKIEENSEGSKLELPYIFYLGYHIELNGEEIPYEESENGFISIEVAKDKTGIVEVSYQGTTLSKVSYIISGVSFIAFIAYIIYEKKKKKIEEKKKKIEE